MKRQKAKELPSCACGCGGRDQGGAGKQGEHDHGHRRTKLNAARLALGAAGFVTGLFLEHLFAANAYILLAVYLAGFLLLGGDVVWKALKNIARGKVFDENFLMSLATAGAFIILLLRYGMIRNVLTDNVSWAAVYGVALLLTVAAIIHAHTGR